MPQTVNEADRGQYATKWEKWPVPQMPDLTGREPWADDKTAFWKQDLTGVAVDAERTARLAQYDVEVRIDGGAPPYEVTSYGMPFNMVSMTDPTTRIQDLSAPGKWRVRSTGTWPWFEIAFVPSVVDNVPLPSVVRREGDPGNSSDEHAYLIDERAKALWEIIKLRHAPGLDGIEWTSGYDGSGRGVCRWDTSRPWNAAGQPRGVVAAAIPHFPLIYRAEELVSGISTHCGFLILPNASSKFVAPARASDGDCDDHPLRYGDRIRVKQSVVDAAPPGPKKNVARWLRQRGVLLGDRNTPRGADPRSKFGVIATVQDRRIFELLGGKYSLRLTDFEVVVPPTI